MKRKLIDGINRFMAWLIIITNNVVFYDKHYRYAKSGNKIPHQYTYWIEHRMMRKKSRLRSAVIKHILKER